MLRRQGRSFGKGQVRSRSWCSGLRRSFVCEHVHGGARSYLREGSGQAIGFDVHVERIKNGCRAHTRQRNLAAAILDQLIHLLLAQQLAGVDPTLSALVGLDLHEAALDIKNPQVIAMLQNRNRIRSLREAGVQIQTGGATYASPIPFGASEPQLVKLSRMTGAAARRARALAIVEKGVLPVV